MVSEIMSVYVYVYREKQTMSRNIIVVCTLLFEINFSIKIIIFIDAK